MSRPLRIEYEGAWYHVMNRGAARRPLFLDDLDRRKFFKLLGEISKIWNIEVHAFCLMGNHYHLLLHTPNAQLSRSLRHLNGVYTQYFNRRYGRDGALFRGRFKSILVDSEAYLLELMRYIHLNPVRAGFCKKPDTYLWSSHRYYLDRKKSPPWLVQDEILGRFGKRYVKARAELKKFVNQGVSKKLMRTLGSKKWPSVLGTTGFKGWVEYNYMKLAKSRDEIPAYREAKRRKVSFNRILKWLLAEYGISKYEVLSRKRAAKNEIRSMLIYLIRQVTGASHQEIADFLGQKKNGAVAKSIQRFSRELETNKTLRLKAESYFSSILSNVQI